MLASAGANLRGDGRRARRGSPRVAAAHSSHASIEGIARYGIRSPKVFAVSMQTMRPLVRSLGRDHALALALWRANGSRRGFLHRARGRRRPELREEGRQLGPSTDRKRNHVLNREAVIVARRLTGREEPPAPWIRRDALREVTSPAVQTRLDARVAHAAK